MQRGWLWGWVLVLAMPSLASAQSSSALACGPVTADAAWAAIPSAERSGVAVDEDHAVRNVAEIELDGAAPAEVVLTVDSLFSELESELGRPRTDIWVLRCRDGRLAPIGRLDLEIDEGWDGTLDERPGVRVLRAETLPGIGHPLARIEQVNVRGSYDPRFVSRRLLLVHVVGDELVVALDAVVRTETESGPDREAGPTTIRSVVYRRGAPPRIRFAVRESDPRGRARTRCRTELTLVDGRFVAADPACR